MIVISDTSCLIAFDRINKLDILHKTFPKIITTKEVAEEYDKQLPGWIFIRPVINEIQIKTLLSLLDLGEASAIALALETENSILIIDEKKGRKIASDLHIKIIGTLKILIIAKQKGVIHSVKEIINELEEANFRFSKPLVIEVLHLCGEL